MEGAYDVEMAKGNPLTAAPGAHQGQATKPHYLAQDSKHQLWNMWYLQFHNHLTFSMEQLEAGE